MSPPNQKPSNSAAEHLDAANSRAAESQKPSAALTLLALPDPILASQRTPRALPMEIPFRDILVCLFRVLRSYADSARAAAVCREWRDVAKENRPPSPMLMLQSTAAAFHPEYTRISPVCWLWRPSEIGEIETLPPTSSPAFLGVFGNGASILPENIKRDYPIGARPIGSFPGGWVALALDGWRGQCLLNVYSGERVPLPDLVRTPVLDVDSVLGIKSIALSAAPTSGSEGEFVVAAITSGATNVAFWRPGLDRWYPPTPRETVHEVQLSDSRAMLPRDPVEDLLYSRGCFFLLYNDEQLVAFMVDNRTSTDDKNLTVSRIRYRFESSDVPDCNVVSRYLVEWRGQIFMIRQLGDHVRFEFCLLVEHGMEATDTMLAQWRRCADLQGRALTGSSRCTKLDGCGLFLGRCCSKAVEVGMLDRIVIHLPYNNGVWFNQ